MEAGNADKEQRKQAPDDDFGLEGKVQDYHRHGGAQGSGRARELEGDIGATNVRHEHYLKKGRPDGAPARRK
jgi:hypothetical protein